MARSNLYLTWLILKSHVRNGAKRGKDLAQSAAIPRLYWRLRLTIEKYRAAAELLQTLDIAAEEAKEPRAFIMVPKAR